MSDNLKDFLKPEPKGNIIQINGSMSCQECNEVVHSGSMSEDDMIIIYRCSKGHSSKVRL